MFYITSRVGVMFAVYDDSDHSVEWYDKEQLMRYARMGIAISGLYADGIVVNTGLSCDWRLCNWTKSKRNIFDVAERVSKSADSIIIYSEGKKYKCKVIESNDMAYHVVFSNGIHVLIPTGWLRNYLKK